MYRTVAQLDSLTKTLAAWFPENFTRLKLPEPSVEGRPVYALRLRAGEGEERRGVLILGGTHARELMNPDAIIELAIDLFISYRNDRDIDYGRRKWTATDVRILLESLDLWLVPCGNPDGREYVMNADDMWRKNRRDNAGSTCDGVDLNRNLHMLWGVTQGNVSCDPCRDNYCGPSAFSEPETRNVKHLLDTRRIDCFLDVHSYSELVLYPWGHAPTQTTDPSQRFTGLPTGTCAPIGVAGYQEYMTPQDLQRFETVAQRIVAAIADVRGRNYIPKAGIDLYGTTGTHSDYAYSRHIADSSLRKTYGFTFETGPFVGNDPDSFHPDDPEPIKFDAKSGMLALAQQCICAIELIGTRWLEREKEISALRRVRDELLGTTEGGRGWIALFERVQGPLVGVLLRDESLSTEAAGLLESAGRLVEDEKATLSEEDVEHALSFIRKLGRLAESDEARRDLSAAGSVLTEMRGNRVGDAIQSLMRRGPAGGKQPPNS